MSLLCRSDLDFGVAPFIQPVHLNPHIGPVGGGSSKTPGPAGDHLLSQLLRLESAVASGDAQPAQRPAPSNTSRSKSSRIEALKATATSLSNRIEYEAQRLAGDDINYGAKTSVGLDTVLAPQTSHTNLEDGSWAQAGLVEKNDVSLSIQRILTSTGHSLHNGTALHGSGDLHPFRGQEEMNRTCANLTNDPTNSAVVAAPGPSGHTHERRKLVNGFERPESGKHGLTGEKNQTDALDSSAGSISEGPILSEGSFSEGDASPPHFSSSRAPPAHHLSAGDSCAGQMKDHQRLSEFQKEASRCPAVSSPFTQHNGAKPAWEELNKGSPLSVINIFTKNLHGNMKGPFLWNVYIFSFQQFFLREKRVLFCFFLLLKYKPVTLWPETAVLSLPCLAVSERNSPPAHSLPSANSPSEAAVYEDDFVSSHSSQGSGRLKRSSSSHR